MNLTFSEADEAFRTACSAFYAKSLPPDIRQKLLEGALLEKDDQIRWQKILLAQGWAAPSWSKAHGGTGWSPLQRLIFEEEGALACAPRVNVVSIDLLGPVLIEFGTPAQKERFLPPILRGDDWWAQGFSEPNSGSDLASLRCKATLDGDEFVIDGSKTWTSHAHFANWIFCLVRTSVHPRKQAGISLVLIPMDSPGVSHRPIKTVGGIHTVNQVFFENVRIPSANLVGAEGTGWNIAKFMLGHERVFSAGLPSSWKLIKQLKAVASRTTQNGLCLASLPSFRDRLALLEIELLALQMMTYRVIAAEDVGAAPGSEASVLKAKGVEIQQSLTEMLMDAAGPVALLASHTDRTGLTPAESELVYAGTQYLDRRKISIFGGSSEIQRNIIAQRILSL